MLVYISNMFFSFCTTYKPVLNIDNPNVYLAIGKHSSAMSVWWMCSGRFSNDDRGTWFRKTLAGVQCWNRFDGEDIVLEGIRKLEALKGGEVVYALAPHECWTSLAGHENALRVVFEYVPTMD